MPRLATAHRPRRDPRAHAQAGFSLVELLIASVLVVLATSLGAMHSTRSAQDVTFVHDSSFARQRAVSILEELKAFVEGDSSLSASSLDEFDDGDGFSPVLSITDDVDDPGRLIQPDNPISGNRRHEGEWVWSRRITVRPLPNASSRDLRMVTVRVFRSTPNIPAPGDVMAEVTSIIRTLGEAYPTTQVYDLYLLALENVPGWWVNMDAIQPFVESTLSELQLLNPGLEFRAHWITKLGYGRDLEYAPYSNESRSSTDPTPWAYVYPGRMPDGLAAQRYYVATGVGGRINLDGQTTPVHVNTPRPAEPYEDENGNGRHDDGERFTDVNDDGERDPGNEVPYAVADVHNHCARWPEEKARFDARVAAGIEDPATPTWRLLLDDMIANPTKYHNAIVVNLHGELLPMPPARNVSDAASDPEAKQGWRAVTHPELLRPARNAATPASSVAPRFRVYAYKTEFTNTEKLTTQGEPFVDANKNGVKDATETFTDWNGNAVWDAELPITLFIPGGDLSQAPNAAVNPSLRVRRLRGGIDADGNGAADLYMPWDDAPRLPESFVDGNADGVCQRAEVWFDLNGNGVRDSYDPWQDLDGDAKFSAVSEALTDANGNGTWDLNKPAEAFTDANANSKWDAAEPYWDVNGNGKWDGPTSGGGAGWVAWNPTHYGNATVTANYVKNNGEPFRDLDGDKKWDAAEAFVDGNGNGVWDGGYRRGEMWFETAYDATAGGTVVTLHGTPLEAPYEASTKRGVHTNYRLYDLDYVPCPTPSTATVANRFDRDLYVAGDFPKNTARWTIELPVAALSAALASPAGAGNGLAQDRIVSVQTRLGTDRTTGTMWPIRRKPANLSTAYAYLYADPASVPFSERYQFQGDPRHSPYADTDRQGTTAVHGYNWFFDDLVNGGTDATGSWLALDGARLDDGWLGRGSGHDVPRLMQWLRTALSKSESLYTTLTGFSYYYLSLGGDVGYDSANGFANSIPMDGTPFGLSGAVNENTLIDGTGTSSIRGSIKLVRSNAGSNASMRSGGMWWSKPWLGELCPDSDYAAQWATWGNLRAATGNAAGTYRLIRRADAPSAQQPLGTALVNLFGRLGNEGCTSFFNVGTSTSTFHHQYADGKTGTLVEDGPHLAAAYGLKVPTSAPISRPFGLATNASGGVGPEFSFTDAYPRHSAAIVRRFYNHQDGQTGSALVRIQEPGAARATHVVVNGVDKTMGSGSSFIARYCVLSLLHGFFAAGAPGLPNRVKQLPMTKIVSPTLSTEIRDPASIAVRFSSAWKRWDGQAYTPAYTATFAESEADLRYVPMYSRDGGDTWWNMRDDSRAVPGSLPRDATGAADAARTLRDLVPGGDETFLWPTPDADFGPGMYLIRVEAYRASEPLHHAHHQEKIHVQR